MNNTITYSYYCENCDKTVDLQVIGYNPPSNPECPICKELMSRDYSGGDNTLIKIKQYEL